jgi:drug/metabolite transporter (DMT)-like permease
LFAGSPWRGIAAVVAAAAAFVANDSLCKEAMLSGIPPMQALFMRGVSASLWCALAIIGLGLTGELRGILNRWVMLRSAAETGAVIIFFFCLAKMPLADITAIIQTAPLIVLIAAAFFFREKIGLWRIPLILGGFAGAIMVANPGGEGVSVYAWLGFLVPIGAAIRDIVSRLVPQTTHGMTAAFAIILFVLLGAGLSHLTFESWSPVSLRHLLLFGAAGLFLTVAQFLIFQGFRMAEAKIVAPFLYSFMIWAVLSDIVNFGYQPTVLGVSGMVLIITCGVLLSLGASERKA